MEAKRSQRLNLIGALLSSGRLLMAKLWHSVNGLWFFGFLMTLIGRVTKPLVVILDNASIHTAKSLQPYWELLEEQGMRFYFLPPYSPELNRIEMLWKKMKYEWLPFQSFTPEELDVPSQEQYAEELGVGTRTVRRWESEAKLLDEAPEAKAEVLADRIYCFCAASNPHWGLPATGRVVQTRQEKAIRTSGGFYHDKKNNLGSTHHIVGDECNHRSECGKTGLYDSGLDNSQ